MRLVAVMATAVAGAWVVNQIVGKPRGSMSEDGNTIPQVRGAPESLAGKDGGSESTELPFSEVDAVTYCGYNAERQMTNPDSYSEKWSWQVLRHPEKRCYTIIRDFTAENAFGGTLAQHYICLLDSSGKGIELRIVDGYAPDYAGASRSGIR